MAEQECPCESGQPYQQCCGQYIENELAAPTPEALMRSRYTAYTQANIDYIEATMRGKALTHFNKDNAKEWARQITWIYLKVLKVDYIPGENHGQVEFIAKYQLQGQPQQVHERSSFEYQDGRWYYTYGILPSKAKIKRNDPCPCGSGKKYKKCCGTA